MISKCVKRCSAASHRGKWKLNHREVPIRGPMFKRLKLLSVCVEVEQWDHHALRVGVETSLYCRFPGERKCRYITPTATRDKFTNFCLLSPSLSPPGSPVLGLFPTPPSSAFPWPLCSSALLQACTHQGPKQTRPSQLSHGHPLTLKPAEDAVSGRKLWVINDRNPTPTGTSKKENLHAHNRFRKG